MDLFLIGPTITPLPKCPQYNPSVISTYIHSVLEEWNRKDAYGILAAISEEEGSVPTLIFGLPPPAITDYVFKQTPYNLPVFLNDDWIVYASRFNSCWDMEPVRGGGRLCLDHISVGAQGDLATAGSFGGFLRSTVSVQDVFGITASHCVPGAPLATTICSPSSLEVTSRFDRILKCTTLCPVNSVDRQPVRRGKEAELRSILDRFHFHETATGSSFYRPVPPFDHLTGTFSGNPIGHIVMQRLEHRPNLLEQYDRWLVQLPGPPRATFDADSAWESRLDFCIFSCHPESYGGNIFDEEDVNEIGALYPEALVEKVGRTTRNREGQVNGYSAQCWHESGETHEIAVMSTQKARVFAEGGDSGGCVFVKENGQYKAGGILIGKNQKTGFALVTPLAMILESAPGYKWA
ncbi:hypothetical protein B9Z19DRAFT_1123064 [Tuber borchii]|uniref:Uncharacterized protein n=1 Tax=Tuber borchii TaxID=42251 RepID=A0A2T6ZZ30_TUBBO|nr:hypothetical protein B9Z19DRAFT_1123064 [Tuber borchii]